MELELCNDPETEGPICFYEQRHYWLSNFSAFAVMYDGQLWPTSEHAYQAMKFGDGMRQEMIRRCTSAHAAMTLAREWRHYETEDWLDVKVLIMEGICRSKMLQHEYIRKKLLKTGDRELIEASPVDAFWGWGPNRDGRNELGKIWMRLREELRR